jgi:hypothetical protein
VKTTKAVGTVQVDVDELWVYYESIGLKPPAPSPAPVYGQGVLRLLDLFERFGIRATFFICGRDLPEQAGPVAAMVDRGHEVANHSTEHRVGFARLGLQEKRADIAEAHRRILQASGQVPVGFKSPGFSFHADQLLVLRELGYLYDSSLLPTPYAVPMRGLQRILSGGQVDPTQYGRTAHGRAALHPYYPDPEMPHRSHRPAAADGPSHPGLWEAPVTTVPWLRVPMHSTFVLTAGRWLFDLGLALVRAGGVPINYLLHAADVVDPVGDPALASYRFLNRPWEAKRPLYEHMLSRLSKAYHLVPTREFLNLGAGGG